MRRFLSFYHVLGVFFFFGGGGVGWGLIIYLFIFIKLRRLSFRNVNVYLVNYFFKKLIVVCNQLVCVFKMFLNNSISPQEKVIFLNIVALNFGYPHAACFRPPEMCGSTQTFFKMFGLC